jgi:metallo-beta-lactamase family protein
VRWQRPAMRVTHAAMRIQFCGADRTVTGSCHLLEINGTRVLLDCGMYQGQRDLARQMNAALPDSPQNLDAVILSHGHLDHCGRLPVLARAGYHGPIYCTPATAEVTRVVLEDAGKIQEEDAAYLNQRSRDPGEPPVKPLYTIADTHDVLKLLRRVPYGQKTTITPASANGKGFSFTFFDAGHILGSAYVLIEYMESNQTKTFLFTADVGRYNSPIIRDPQPLPGPVDQVITESTYGGKKHAPMDQIEPEFLDAVKFCIDRKSRLLVPSFAVGRTQTMLWYMQKFVQEKRIPPIHVYVDSPMGVEMTKVYSDFRDNYDEQTASMIGKSDLFGLARVTYARSSQESRQINSDRGPCVIVASSPTCEFGRILHHLVHSVEQPNDMVIFVGWIPPQTLGRRLQDGEKRVRILDRWYDVRCQVRTLHGLSAHADGDELLRFLQPTLKPQTQAYVVHGEEDQAEIFARRLLQSGVGRATVPAMESSVITSVEGLPDPMAQVQPDSEHTRATDND